MKPAHSRKFHKHIRSSERTIPRARSSQRSPKFSRTTARDRGRIALYRSGRAWLRAAFCSRKYSRSLEKLAGVGRSGAASGESVRTRGCMRIERRVGGAGRRPRPPFPLWQPRGGAEVRAIGRQPVREVVPALIILNKSSPLRRLIIEFAVP